MTKMHSSSFFLRMDRMVDIITQHWPTARIKGQDESSRHAGHAGARPEGQTHYHLHIVAQEFEGLSRIQRHRKIQDMLAQEFDNGLHALRLTLRTPTEEETASGGQQ